MKSGSPVDIAAGGHVIPLATEPVPFSGEASTAGSTIEIVG